MGDTYVENDSLTFDAFLSDVFMGTVWRRKLEDMFEKELEAIKKTGKSMNERRARRAACKALRTIHKEVQPKIVKANCHGTPQKNIPLENIAPEMIESKNDKVAQDLCSNVKNELNLNCNLIILRKMADALGINTSQKTKIEICDNIALKLTKPNKVKKSLHRGKWEPIITKDGEYNFGLVKYYGGKEEKPSLQYTITRTYQNMCDTLEHDISNLVINKLARQFHIKGKDKHDTCRQLTKHFTSPIELQEPKKSPKKPLKRKSPKKKSPKRKTVSKKKTTSKKKNKVVK